MLNTIHSGGFNTNAPIVARSWADTGSGICAFPVTAVVLGLVTARDEPARAVRVTPLIAGGVAPLLDVFVR